MSKTMRVPDLFTMKKDGIKITMVTAYDYSSARIVDEGGADCIIVGDSLGSVVQGAGTTLSVTLDEMIYHTRLVVRGTKRALVVSDMPFMSYQISPEQGLESAGRIVKGTGAAAVKLEGGVNVAETIARITAVGIPVMGHVGLCPQSYHALGGYCVQGKTTSEAERIIQDARSVQDAGAFALVLEAVPASLARKITEELHIPTIGIGAGAGCAGQVLVFHDLVGFGLDGFMPRFVKQYANAGEIMKDAVKSFVSDVQGETFPEARHTYKEG